jgi:hypothetical protein
LNNRQTVYKYKKIEIMKKNSFIHHTFNSYTFVFIIFTIAFFANCEKLELQEDDNIQNIEQNTKTDTDNEIVLGKHIGMSNSLKNIKKSMTKHGYITKSGELEANAVYVKITPSSPDEIAFIDTGSNFAIYDYPLDYEILEEGDYYIEPDIQDTLYNPRYAIVEDVDDIPVNVQYEVEEELRMPETEEEEAAYLYTQLLTGEIELPEGIDTMGYIEENKAGWYPNLRIVLNQNGVLKNMSNIMLRIGARTYTTDANGKVQCKKHYGQIKVESRFYNSIAKVRKGFYEFIGIDRYDVIKRVNPSGSMITIQITKDGVENTDVWHKATIYESILKYNSYCSQNDIQQADDLNIWTSPSIISAGCPLFRRLGGVNFTMLHTFVQAFITGLDFGTSTLDGLLINHLTPDILMTELEYTMDYDLYAFHELSHFSHAVKRGWSFWHTVVNSEVWNMTHAPYLKDPYKNGNYPTVAEARYIALAESWAYFMATKIGQDYDYSVSHEYFYPRTIPYYQVPYDKFKGWIPNGVYWDMLDNIVDPITLKDENNNLILSGYDNFNGENYGITVNKLYNVLTNSSCNSVSNFKSIFKSQYPNLATQTDALFALYGY